MNFWKARLLVFALQKCFGWDCLRIRGSLIAGADSILEPDAAVTQHNNAFYLKTGTPCGEEFCLVAEVSDTTLWRDKGQKAKLYAEAEVPEYWIVNITGRTLIVHRNPVDGEYRSIQTYDDTQSVAPEAAPDHPITLSEILPPKE